MNPQSPPDPDPRPVRPYRNAAAEVRRLFELGWPVSASALGLYAMLTVNVVVVGHLGGHALGAVAIGSLWAHAFTVVARGLLHALDPVVSQAFGRGDRLAAGQAMVRGLLLALIVSIPSIAILQVTDRGLAFLGQPEALIPDATTYARALSWGVPAFMGFWSLRLFLQGLGVMRPATVAVVAANVLNLVLNPILVFGVAGWQGLGIPGSAYATVISQWFTFLALVWISRDTLRAWWPSPVRAFAFGPMIDLLAIGVPVALQLGLEMWAFQAAGLMMGWFGTEQVGAHSVAMNLGGLAFMVPLGLSAAAATRVGNLLGAELPWQRSGWLAIAMGASFMCVTGALFFSLPGPLVRLYTDDAEVAAIAAMLVPIAAVFGVFDGTQVTSFGVLRGAGDVRFPSIFNLVGYWFFGLPLGWWLAFRRGWGPVGLWWGLVFALVLIAALLLVRVAWVSRRGGFSVHPPAPREMPAA